jgi:lathosterol oxidase
LIGAYLVHALGGTFFYLASAGASYYFFFKKDGFYPDTLSGDPKHNLKEQVKNEISYALWSIPLMAVLMMPFPLLLINGYGKVYDRVDGYGWGYLLFSIVFFLVFTDGMIYFVHRGFHHPSIYWFVHKPHHPYRHTTPFSSHSFHPLDGFGQKEFHITFSHCCFPFRSTYSLLCSSL